jgi:hypothetical protein
VFQGSVYYLSLSNMTSCVLYSTTFEEPRVAVHHTEGSRDSERPKTVHNTVNYRLSSLHGNSP